MTRQNNFNYQQVKLVAITRPFFKKEDGNFIEADDFVAYCARVSNPKNQNNLETGPKLIRYLIEHEHWSPFEMVHLAMEITTTRDIGRQILRHRSFSFQEFSQRYAEVVDMIDWRETRMQDPKNRQNSIKTKNTETDNLFRSLTRAAHEYATVAYKQALKAGIAKEQARALLPEGLTLSTMYMAGTLRSWLHYVVLRATHGTQAEHQDIAFKVKEILWCTLPSLREYLDAHAPTA